MRRSALFSLGVLTVLSPSPPHSYTLSLLLALGALDSLQGSSWTPEPPPSASLSTPRAARMFSPPNTSPSYKVWGTLHTPPPPPSTPTSSPSPPSSPRFPPTSPLRSKTVPSPSWGRAPTFLTHSPPLTSPPRSPLA